MYDLYDIREALERESGKLQALIRALKKRQSAEMTGSLQITGGRNRQNYYSYDLAKKNPRQYLSKKDTERIIALAQQDHERDLLRAAERELSAVQRSLRILPEDSLESVYTRLSKSRKQLVTPPVPDRELFIREWSAVTYLPGRFDEDTPVFYSERGERVRSKSEKISADKYLHLSIPYRYEYPIQLLDGRRKITFRPDFTLLNKRTCKVYYHQHLGMLDDPEYLSSNLWKLKIFENNGIMLGEQLFFTYETRDMPFDDRQLDRMIERYLL